MLSIRLLLLLVVFPIPVLLLISGKLTLGSPALLVAAIIFGMLCGLLIACSTSGTRKTFLQRLRRASIYAALYFVTVFVAARLWLTDTAEFQQQWNSTPWAALVHPVHTGAAVISAITLLISGILLLFMGSQKSQHSP